MAIKVINIGTSANKGDGEPLRTAFDKINDNFSELSLKVTNLETGGVTVTTGDIKGSVFGDDSTLLVDGINSKIPSANLSGALPAIDGSALTGVTTTETDPVVGAITGIVKADGSGNISAAVAGTDYLTTVAFADLTSKPTTVAGYGITDALTSVPAQSFASLTGKPTTIAGYGITDALELGTSATTALAGNTALFSGAYNDLTGKPSFMTDVVNDTTPQLGGNLGLSGKDILGVGNINLTPGTITATSGTLGSIQLIDNNISSTDSTQLSIQTPTSFTNAGAPGVTIDGNITFEATGAITGPAVDIYGIGNGQVKIGNTGSSINPVLVGNANTAVTVEGDLTVSDEAKFQRGVQHKYSTIDSATGVTAHDCNSGQFFRHTNIAGDITVNLTNLNLNNGYSTEIVLLIEQGASARNVTALQIGGQAQTLHVQSGQNVNTNTKDTILIKLWRTGSGATDYIAMREIYNH